MSEKIQWIILGGLFVWVALLTVDRSRLAEEFRAHSDGMEMLRYNDSSDAMGIIRLESRIKRLETRLANRRIGDAP